MKNILETLSKEEKNKIEMKLLKKGEILFSEGDHCEHVGIIVNGEIDIVSYSYGGNEIIFSHLTDGMMFGNNLVFSSQPMYKGSILAKKPTKLALISKKLLMHLLKNNDEFLISFLNYQSDLTKELNNRIKLLSLDNAEERFFYYLHSQGDKITYCSITDLARHLYLQRETLSRLISKLVQEGKILKKDKMIWR